MANAMYPAKVNSPKTELSATVTASDTSITVVDASKLQAAPNICTLLSGDESETISYTGITNNTLTGCVRGLNGTAKAWAAGVKVARTYTAYDHDAFISQINELVQKTSAASTTSAGIVQLSSATTSTAVDKAATPAAVKTAKDAADSAATAATNAEANAKTYADNKKSEIVNTGFVGSLASLSAPSNYNNATAPGKYHFVATSTITNEPVAGSGARRCTLEVESQGGIIIQRLRYNAGQYEGFLFDRIYDNGWGNWKTISTGNVLSGTGTPEGAVTAPAGSIFQRLDGGVSTSQYVKETNSGNTGWKAK